MQVLEQRAEHGRGGATRWRPGQSGNPDGKSKAARQARLDALVTEWCEPFGGVAKLNPAERLLAWLVVMVAGPADVCWSVSERLARIRRARGAQTSRE